MSAFSRALREPVYMLTINPYIRTSARVFESRPTDEQWRAMFDARVRENLERRGIQRRRAAENTLPLFLRKQAS